MSERPIEPASTPTGGQRPQPPTAARVAIVGGAVATGLYLVLLAGLVLGFYWLNPPPERPALDAEGDLGAAKMTLGGFIQAPPGKLPWTVWLAVVVGCAGCVMAGIRL